MIKVPTEQGEITISDAVFTTITGAAATNCFGVKGMAQRSMTDGLVHLLRPEAMSKGVKVTPGFVPESVKIIADLAGARQDTMLVLSICARIHAKR